MEKLFEKILSKYEVVPFDNAFMSFSTYRKEDVLKIMMEVYNQAVNNNI